MFIHLWSILSRYKIIDKETGNFSLFEVIDHMHVEASKRSSKSAVVPEPFTWLTNLRRKNVLEPATGQLKDLVLSPSGETLYENEYKLDLSRYVAMCYERSFVDFEVTESGDYHFIVKVRPEGNKNWSVICDLPVYIQVIPQKKKSLRSKSTSGKRGKAR